MFADTLRGARTDAGLSVAVLAAMSGTSRAAISDYESGKKVPRFDTAERILAAIGEQYVAVSSDARLFVRVDRSAFAALETWLPNRQKAIAGARSGLASLIEADAIVERLDVSWGQVKTLTNGTTVTGDALAVWRLHELLDDARHLLHLIDRGQEPHLQVLTADRLVTDRADGKSIPQRAMGFLARATASGADPAFVRHLVGAFLAHHGFPWLWVPYKLADDYRMALVACRRNNDGTSLVRVHCASLERVDW